MYSLSHFSFPPTTSMPFTIALLIQTSFKLLCSVLERLPSPLPGLEQPQQLQPLLSWALQLTHSPRVRESDAGARLLRLLLIKHVLGLKWRIQLYPEPLVQGAAVVAAGGEEGASSSAKSSSRKGAAAAGDADAHVHSVMCFLSSLTGQLRSQLVLAHTDLAAASRRGLVHGIVLALRYAADETPWARLASSSSTATATVSAAAAAAAAGGSSTALEVQPVASSTSSCNGAAAAAAGVAGASSSALVVVRGAALLVLRAWLADLFGLLTEAAQLAQPYLSAQVSFASSLLLLQLQLRVLCQAICMALATLWYLRCAACSGTCSTLLPSIDCQHIYRSCCACAVNSCVT
jgi:hypothetical protein